MSLSHKVIGCALEVHRTLGCGFLESVYERAMSKELLHRSLGFSRQVMYPVHYKGEQIGRFMADMVVEQKLILELKAVDQISPTHVAQLINYLQASGIGVGLLLNFGTPSLQIKRLVH